MRARLAAVVVALGGLAAPAWAQISSTSSEPVYFSADQGEVVNSQCLTTLRGSAEAIQGQSRLRAHTITIVRHPQPKSASPAAQSPAAPGASTDCGPTDRMEADGEVYYVTPTQTARGDHALYTAASGLIVMTGNVVVVEGKDVVTGDRLTIEVATTARMDSVGRPAGKPARVRGVFYPSQPGGLAAPAPAPGAAAAARP